MAAIIRTAPAVLVTPPAGPLGQMASIRLGPGPAHADQALWQIDMIATLLADGRLQIETLFSTGEPLRPLGSKHTQVGAEGEVITIHTSDASVPQALALVQVARLVDGPPN